jgi:hypothetical protein
VLAFAAQLDHEFFQGQRIDDIGLGKPAFAGDSSAKAQKPGVLEAVRVAIDDAFDALAFGVGQSRQSRSKRYGLAFNSIQAPDSAHASMTACWFSG